MTRVFRLMIAVLMVLANLMSPDYAGGTPAAHNTGIPAWEQRPSTAGRLSVRGTGLVGENGRAVQLRGASTHGLAWFPQFVNADLFREMSENWGANCVRLAMYTAEYGGYCTGGDREALKKLILDGVGYAAQSDMYVIVDWHILSDGDPNTYKSQAVEFFSDITAQLADYDNVLYEICNEPNGSATWKDIKDYAAQVIPAIRENAPDAVVLVGTPNWSQRVDEAARDPITGFDNIMYTLHFYSGTHRGELRRTLRDAHEAGIPIFVSEYGITDASGGGALNTDEADRWMELLDEYSISYMMWSLSNKDESSAIISSKTDKTSGFTQDDLTGSGKYLLEILPGHVSKSPSKGGQTPEEEGRKAGQTGGKQPSGEGVSGADGVNWELDAINSWASGDSTFTQYVLTVTNSGDTPVDTWRVELDMDGGFALISCWNGVFTVEGGTLTVEPADYNASVPAGGSVSDIGFILER